MISYSLPPFYSGAGQQALRLGQALVERGLEVTALTGRHRADLPAHETVGGVDIHRLPVVRDRRLRHLSFFLTAAWHVIHHRDEYDIVHLHGAYRRAIPIVAAARLVRLPVVVKMSMMGTDDPSTTRNWRFGDLLMKALRHADAVVAITDELAQSYLQAGLPEEHLVRIPNGVDTSRFHPVDGVTRVQLRRELELPPNAPVVLFVGVVNPRKGVDRLLQAWPPVQSQWPEAVLLLVGPVPASRSAPPDVVETLRSRATQYRIRILGQQAAVERFYQAADLFVLPARMEGLPNALLEAMACGLPVVASALPGVSEVIQDGVNGLLLRPADPQVLSAQILRLLQDARCASELGPAAHQTIEQGYALGAIVDRYRNLYGALIKKRSIEV